MITQFIAHLKDALTFKVIFAYTMDPVEQKSEEIPMLMVYPGSLGAEDSEVDNFVRQRVTLELVCLLCCAIDDYDTRIAELRAAALGWVNGNSDDTELSASETLNIVGDYIWVRETYTIQYHITQS